ncbi:heparan-sulfate 6-O-sulfotransferase 3-like [Tropilaelaps mercedesae]|uniref:Heparan-sulfate 6-O-sulfotransferase n=1 Tax=Tropilaelaps mercedesae TaxID=418985 RepID=A0A1V9X477_9ACAR|nr:heparan-sulfate 6-O-sulfotransferase 3-like [Tropilaelaps mercedesae]
MIRLRAREPGTQSTHHNLLFRYGTNRFDPFSGRDMIVFVQIQNAGANFFEKHIIENLNVVEKSLCVCTKKNGRKQNCRCHSDNTILRTGDTPWLFSRLSGGWACGVHAGWTQLVGCVDRVLDEVSGEPRRRRYLYITFLREPVRRFRSEWLRFVEQRETRPSRVLCGSREHALPDVQECFKGVEPAEVTLEEFALCKDNLALNRQTRMLADLRLVNCYDGSINQTQRDMILLHSAKTNLHHMAFFGIAEFPNISQRMFEAAFGVQFRSRPRHRFNRLSSYLKRSPISSNTWSAQTEATVRQVNHLDMQLYEYGKELLFERFHHLFKEGPREDEDPDWADGDDFFMDR